MTSMLIRDADGIFTGLPGDAMRATGAIRVIDGRIAAIGNLAPEPGEEIIDASGCVIYPGLVSTHHHLFQSILKGVRAGINLPLMGWLRSVPHSYWHRVNEEELYTAAQPGPGCLRGGRARLGREARRTESDRRRRPASRPAPGQPFVGDPRLCGVLPEQIRQAPGALDCRARLARPGRMVRASRPSGR